MSDNFVLAQIWVSICALTSMYFFLVKRQRNDRFRSELRVIRDGLFDAMVERGFDLQCPAYRETRQILNGMIRLSNSTGPIRFILLVAKPTPPLEEFVLEKVTDQEIKTLLSDALDSAMRAWITHIFLTGCTGLLVKLIFWLSWPVSWAKERFERFQYFAFEFGKSDLTFGQRAVLR